MKFLEVDGLGKVSRIGLGTWQFGSREWGYGDAYAAGAARDIVSQPVSTARFAVDSLREKLGRH